MPISAATLQEAEAAIRRKLRANGFRAELEYAPDQIVETGRWRYVPFCWIGCEGFIVNKGDLYVNWLGSALDLEDCFWGHDRNVFCDLVDFTFSPDTNPDLAARLFARFKHMRSNAAGISPRNPVGYRQSEIAKAFSNWFPTFRRHSVWHCIPELKQACERDGLRFTCALSKRA